MMSSNCDSVVTSIGVACGGNRALHLPHLPVSARWRTGTRLTALHSAHTRRMRKCYGAAVAKTKGKSQKGSAAVDLASKAIAINVPPPQSRPLVIAAPPPTKGKGQKGKAGKPAKVAKAPAPKKLPQVAVKPARPTKPSLPPPPPAPEVEPPRDELPAPRDIARLTRY